MVAVLVSVFDVTRNRFPKLTNQSAKTSRLEGQGNKTQEQGDEDEVDEDNRDEGCRGLSRAEDDDGNEERAVGDVADADTHNADFVCRRRNRLLGAGRIQKNSQ